MATLLGDEMVAPDVPGGLTRVITRETPLLGGFAWLLGGPSTAQAASWRVWSSRRTSRLALPRRSRPYAELSCSPLRRRRGCFGLRGSSSTRTRRRSAAGACSAIADRGASHAANCLRADRRRDGLRRAHPAPVLALVDASELERSVRRCFQRSPAARRASAVRRDELRSVG